MAYHRALDHVTLAGLYLHIPFCTRRCSYCNYFVSTQANLEEAYVEALLKEIEARREDVNEKIASVYLGGGTPSKLSIENLSLVFNGLRSNFDLDDDVEIGMEANPEDINKDVLISWNEMGINRLSLGIQSTSEEQLNWMKRTHSSEGGRRAVEDIRKSRFASNFSLDLIFGLPNQSLDHWISSLDQFLHLEIPHFSLYGLETIEDTVLAIKVARAKLPPADEDVKGDMYIAAYDKLVDMNYRPYELASFAKPGKECRHNLHYWEHSNYLGFGASAHSMIWQKSSIIREVNVSDLASYIADPLASREKQVIEGTALANEYIMIRLRTYEGLDLRVLKEEYAYNMLEENLELVLSFNELGLIEDAGDQHFRLTRKGRQQAEPIMAALLL